MLTVSDTSPICNLAKIGCLELLKSQFGNVLVPPAVERELQRLAHPEASRAIRSAFEAGWLNARALNDQAVSQLLSVNLDEGESEAIASALEVRANWILVDERDGRAAAALAGLHVIEVLGVLLRAHWRGELPDLEQALCHLHTRARFHVSADLERRILDSARHSTESHG